MQHFEVKFERSVQELGPLQEAAGRLIGSASCRISADETHYAVTIEASAAGGDEAVLRCRYLDLVTDENLRAKIRGETEGIRNVILALAFGSLVQESHTA